MRQRVGHRHKPLREEVQELDVRLRRPRSSPVATNASLARLYGSAGRGRGAAAEIDPSSERERSNETDEVAVTASPESFELRHEGEDPGYASDKAQARAEAAAASGQTSSSGVDADVQVRATTNERFVPQAEIQETHDRPDVAGWTSWSWNLSANASDSTSVSIVIALDVEVELADEYMGRALDVLRDHEYGHVDTTLELADQILVKGLEGDLEALPVLRPAPAQAVIDHALSRLRFLSQVSSYVYDFLDYPRMREAYFGANTILDHLVAKSSNAGTVVDVVRQMIEESGDSGSLSSVGTRLHAAVSALSDIDLTRLQYNEEFGRLVAAAQNVVVDLEEKLSGDPWALNRLKHIGELLGSFTWKMPGQTG